jgi:ubiquinone/menaquinone biosynthesis C-methylase UbiE
VPGQKGENPDSKAQTVCPRWLCFTFDNPVRKLFQNPERILKPYIKEGWTVLDAGPGMGYFTIPLARLVGEKGTVIAADVQRQMLEAIKQRASKAAVANRIKLHLAAAGKIGVTEPVDFALAFWMAHEVSDQSHFINEIASILKPGGLFLVVEPKLHVSRATFAKTVEIAKKAGLTVIRKPSIFISNAVLLQKSK